MPSFALTKFETFAASTSGEQAFEFLFQSPVLWLSAYWPEFTDWAQQLPLKQSDLGVRAFNALVGFSSELTADNYPLGTGPLEQIIQRIYHGEINESFARQFASAIEVYQNLSPLYVAALSMSNQRLANEGRWRDALLAQNVLLAALDTRRPAEQSAQDEMEMLAAIDYAVIAARSVWESADGRLFRDAVRRATTVSEVDTRPWHEPGEVEFSLGVLHPDPYIYQGSVAKFKRMQRVPIW